MKVEKVTYPDWYSVFPVYRVTNSGDYFEITEWMYKNKVEYFDLSTGSGGYVFQIRNNIEWFALKWQ